MAPTRRELLRSAALAAAAVSLGRTTMASRSTRERWHPEQLGYSELLAEPKFKISLAQWSLHRALQAGEMTNLEFPVRAKREFGIEAVEYVNRFFAGKERDEAYLAELDKRCLDEGVRSLLIMVDGEGELAHADDARRAEAVTNHHKWIDAAAALHCHSIRVNAAGAGEREEVAKRAAESLRQLAEYAQPHGLNVLVENHGGISSEASWLADVMKLADHPRVGTLPDFGNFELDGGKEYDRYQGVRELMPYAKAVSAKSHDFDEAGQCVETDYAKMLAIVVQAGYRGFVGIEYEGKKLSEPEGILATKKLLERVRAELG
jgi:sugar phosphate isomerase/epimerase